ncbi:MAG TPA: tetratricopeptide repeat protein [Bacteroidales bacterium]|nr:tetratricopeptide repeat protein [Bacteroidales bacterium]
MKKLFFVLFILQFSILHGFSIQENTKIDSLFKELKNHKPDTNTLKVLIEIADEYENISSDSALKYNLICVHYSDIVYYNSTKTQDKTTAYRIKGVALRNMGIIHTIRSDIDKALEYYFHSLRTYSIINDNKGKAAMFRYIGIAYYYIGSYDIAIKYYKYALNFAIATLDTVQLSNIYSNIGIIYHRQGEYEKAMDFYIKQMKLLEHTQDQKGLSACYINLGNLYKDQKNFKEALRYYNLAIPIKEKLEDKQGIANVISNIGNVYYKTCDFQKAENHYFKALSIYEGLNDKQGQSTCYANLGALYSQLKNYKKALEYYLKSDTIDHEIGDQIGNLYNIGGIATAYIILSDSTPNQALKMQYAKKALEYAKKLEVLSLKTNINTERQEAYNYQYRAYTRLGNYKEAIKYAEKAMELNDSLISEHSTQVLAEMQTKYETEKKQLQIEKLNKENELKQSKLEKSELQQKRQKTIIYSILSIFFIVVVFSFFLSRLYLQLKKSHVLLKQQKEEIELKNEELKTANEEIRIQKEEIETQRDIVVAQKEEIEIINKKLTDSIEYASNIQQAVLPEPSYAIDHLQEKFDMFILFKPKDIVSGDFYWFTNVGNIHVFTVADCTGHGVPGAFMSMLGISLLNEIVRKKEVTTASQVLEELRKGIIHALHQKGKQGEQKDGMDIAFIAIDTEKHELQFAGANNSIYLIRNTEIQKISGDKMPVAIYERMQSFTNNIIEINKGDVLYLSSDGIKDQFGGPQCKKFLAKQFEQVLLSHANESMNAQKEALSNAIHEWRNINGRVYEQTDDITVMGIKILF